MKKIIFGISLLIAVAFLFFSLSKKDETFSEQKTKTDSIHKKNDNAFVYDDGNLLVKKSITEFESFIKTILINKQAAGAAIAIVKDTSIIFLKGYGLREYGKSDSINSRTVFRIGSVSKSVTATLCAVLVDEGIIHWNDPVIKYLPDFKLKSEEATKKLTLAHLLSHTEGLPYHAFTNMVDKNVPVDSLIDDLQDLDLIAEPGKIHSYQNVGFSLIGKVIEAATKKPFEEVLIEKLFTPLGMVDASASYQKISASENVAQPHLLVQPRKISKAYYSVAPAGGVNASAQDLGLWLKAMLSQNSTVLKEKRLEEIFTPQVWAPTHNFHFNEWKRVRRPSYGLGWRVLAFADDTIVYHGGYVNNYRCEVAMNRKKKIGIALLVSAPGVLADQGVPTFFKIYEHNLDSIKNWKRKDL